MITTREKASLDLKSLVNELTLIQGEDSELVTLFSATLMKMEELSMKLEKPKSKRIPNDRQLSPAKITNNCLTIGAKDHEK